MIVVGAPVHQRGWILQQWFDHLAEQTIGSQELCIVLNYGNSTDETREIIDRAAASNRFERVVTLVDPQDDHQPHRKWNAERYETMVRLRNDLLGFVRLLQPEFYLSCDTDMLLPPNTLKTLMDDIGSYDAIAPLTHMTPSGMCPNAFAMNGQRMHVADVSEVTQMYAVFGTVLMTPKMYQSTLYAVNQQGEDIGWAKSAWEQHLLMAIDPYIKVKHVMNPEMLDAVDIRVGF